MPKFRYTAIDITGKRSKGVLEAVSAAAVADRLQRQSCMLLRADEVGKGGWFDDLIHSPTRLAIVSLLAASEWADFSYIRDTVELSEA